MFKSNKQLILAAVALLTGSQAFAGTFTSSVSATSDYIWRGISLSGDDPSVGISGAYAFDNGFSLSAAANKVDFNSNGQNYADAEVELLITGAFTTKVRGADVSLAATAYNYLDESTPDGWSEFSVGFDLPVSNANVGMEIKYSSDTLLGSGDTYTTFAHFAMPFTKSAVAASVYYVDSKDVSEFFGSKDHYKGAELSYGYDWTPSLSTTLSYSYAVVPTGDNGLFGKVAYKIC